MSVSGCSYWDKRALANSLERGVCSGSTIFAIHPADLDTSAGCKMILSKIFDKCDKELKYPNTVDSRYLYLAYLKVKIWRLLKHENLITGNKILWRRGEIAPKEQFLLFSTIF